VPLSPLLTNPTTTTNPAPGLLFFSRVPDCFLYQIVLGGFSPLLGFDEPSSGHPPEPGSLFVPPKPKRAAGYSPPFGWGLSLDSHQGDLFLPHQKNLLCRHFRSHKQVILFYSCRGTRGQFCLFYPPPGYVVTNSRSTPKKQRQPPTFWGPLGL